jgi:hypothetical protein
MSGSRLYPGRLTLAAAFVLLGSLSSWFLGCTERTPNYCDDSRHITCPEGQVCSSDHACVISDAAGDAARTDGGDAPAADAPAGDAPLDRPGDGPRDGGDAGDGTEARKGCVDSLGCTADPGKPACNVDAGVCVGCVQSTDCTNPQAPVCDTSVNRCVQCTTSRDCTNPTPFCDAQACRACRVDAECAGIGPEVCMAHIDGHCATDDETVYVQNITGSCSGPNPDAGSALPFCMSQDGIDATAGKPIAPPDASTDADAGDDAGDAGPDALHATKTLVVMRGPFLTEWSFGVIGRTITVVGQSGAAILAGGRVGIHVSAGTVYVRGLRVSQAATTPAVVADGGELHLDRCIVDNNAAGGLLIAGAAYDITNTVIANNKQNTITANCGGWGGVCIKGVAQGQLGRFLNNTVAKNELVGVACDGPYPLLGSIVTGNASDTAVCSLATCCGTGDPGLDLQTYHLSAGSPCIDKLDPAMSTAYDLDGHVRPFGTMSDCGASEFIPATP